MAELVDRWRTDPVAAADALDLEYTALTLNPRSMLFGRRTAHQLVTDHGLTEAAGIATARMSRRPWSVYEVRRVFHAKDGNPAIKARGPRSVRCLYTGRRHTARNILDKISDRYSKPVDVDQWQIPRVRLHLPGPPYPSREAFITIAPAGVQDKDGPGFDPAWLRTA